MGKVEEEVERQLDLMREGCVDFFGEEELRERLPERLAEGRMAKLRSA